jgi:hypothetical protein
MKINLTRTESNTTSVNAALAAVNGRAEAFTITSWAYVAAIAQQVEDQLALSGVPLAARKGVTVRHYPDGPAAKAYKYNAISTVITLERGAKDWFLTDVKPTTLYPQEKGRTLINISAEQREIVVKHALAPFTTP